MIYANFFYFIAVLSLLSVASPFSEFSSLEIALNLLVTIFTYSTLVFVYFENLDRRYISNQINYRSLAKLYSSGMTFWIGTGVMVFGIQLFFFDLKALFRIPRTVPGADFITNFCCLLIFMLHLILCWYIAFRTSGRRLGRPFGAGKYVLGQVKFNLVILIPWVVLSIITEIVSLIWGRNFLAIDGSLFFQVVFFVTFLGVAAFFAPILMVKLWDCKPLEDVGLQHLIDGFSKRTGIHFKQVLSWNALNGTLVTAGVIGFVKRFRYLLITPELMRTLDTAEILGVVGHEAGHVKKRHILLYMMFFIGFILLNIYLMDWLVIGVVTLLNNLFAFNFLNDNLGSSSLSIITVLVSLLMFFVYFRYLFGYFMRNFERQADCFCYEAGIPLNFLISAFQKLGPVTGDDGKKSNWHHYNITERIEFLKKVEEDSSMVDKHNSVVRRNILNYLLIMGLLIGALANPFTRMKRAEINLGMYASAVEQKINRYPENYTYYSVLGMVYYNMKQWGKVKSNFEQSLLLNRNQPDTLNNYAWFLLKCPVEAYHDPFKALELSRFALSLKKEAHIYDTFAEAALKNGLYEEALWASGKALKIKPDDQYFHQQHERMKRKARIYRDRIIL